MAYRPADPEDQPQVDAIRPGFVLEQERKAEEERDEAAYGEHPVRRRVQVDDQQDDAEQHEREPSPARSEHREAVQGQHEAHGAERAGQHDAGMEHLEDEPDDPEQEEQADQVRVDDRVEEAREEAGLDRVDLGVRQVQREGPLLVLRVVAVQLLEERGQRRRDRVDHVHLQRLLRSEVRGSAHGLRRPARVAVMNRRERGQRGDRVVDHLAAQVRAEIRAARVDRRRRADVRVRRHGEHVGGLGDPDPGRGGAGAFRRDVDDHRHLRGELGLVDRLHRGREAAGRVEQDHRGVVAVVRRVRELAREVALRDGVDLEVGPEGDRQHARPGARACGTTDEDERGKHDEERSLHDAIRIDRGCPAA